MLHNIIFFQIGPVVPDNSAFKLFYFIILLYTYVYHKLNPNTIQKFNKNFYELQNP